MHEYHLTAVRNGITDVDITIDNNRLFDASPEEDNPINPDAISVTVTFAVTTDSTAWMTIDGDGTVHPSFGGTGTPQHELDEYAEQAVGIWREITGDEETTCRYSVSDTGRGDSGQAKTPIGIDA